MCDLISSSGLGNPAARHNPKQEPNIIINFDFSMPVDLQTCLTGGKAPWCRNLFLTKFITFKCREVSSPGNRPKAFSANASVHSAGFIKKFCSSTMM